VPLDKLVIGKPLTTNDLTAGGFMTPNDFGGCLKEGQQKKWNGGYMYWQWNYKDGPTAVKAIGA
jgi:chitinase